jgi:hypothetical protein
MITTITSNATTITLLGNAGPPGPQGQTGAPGAAGPGTPYDTLAAQTGAQTIILPASGVLAMLFVNGLRQPQGYASLTGTSLTIPAILDVVAGDTITILLTT